MERCQGWNHPDSPTPHNGSVIPKMPITNPYDTDTPAFLLTITKTTAWIIALFFQ
jgi:hypothetical protein